MKIDHAIQRMIRLVQHTSYHGDIRRYPMLVCLPHQYPPYMTAALNTTITEALLSVAEDESDSDFCDEY